jgi:hypothetical protein
MLYELDMAVHSCFCPSDERHFVSYLVGMLQMFGMFSFIISCFLFSLKDIFAIWYVLDVNDHAAIKH